MDDASSFYSGLARGLEGDLARSRDSLVPPAYTELWEQQRFSVWYGGRAAAKSWSIARVLVVLAHEAPLRVLCCREIQGSIRESAYRLLADQIQLLELDDAYVIGADNITARNGSRFFFEGLRYNASKIRSYEGVDIVWVEEAQTVSELSWETLLPTIRKPGSRFYISFNPLTRDDPVSRRFVDNSPPGTIARKVSYRDNPHLSLEAEVERAWLEKTDPDAYRHVWEGFPREASDALILRGKFTAEEFDISPAWAGPYHGLDYGFSRDPSAAVRCYIDDETRTLYVSREFWALGTDIDALPGALETAIQGISRYVVHADSARPESTSYLARNGIPNARSAEKWPGSVDDGIAYLRAFSQIVVDPACKHFLDECRSYSFKVDRLTGVPLPEPQDKNNHLIDALRYALSPLIRNLPAGGYFNRAALLERGEPVGSPSMSPLLLFGTAAITDRAASAVGTCLWSLSPNYGHYLTLLDYDLSEMGEVCSIEWAEAAAARLQELAEEFKPHDGAVALWVEAGELYQAMRHSVQVYLERVPAMPFSLRSLTPEKLLGRTLDERASFLRMSVNSGGLVKLHREAYLKQTTHRSVTANHLVSQVLGYRPAADAAQELAAAFVMGCAIAYDPRKRPAAERAVAA
ncbi:MAG TPA: PBSX family phage terminase large subunit [Steroidobacteraceae bacterium]|nr:PBSX family phage terminase large subunit [Steroidobacteraceae bacterium]